MKKLFLLTIMFITLMVSCNENEIIDPPTENQSVSKKRSSKKEVSLTQKAAATFNQMLLTKGVKESLSTIIQDDIAILEGIHFQGNIFEDHVMLRTDHVFEDNIMILTNSTFEISNENIFETYDTFSAIIALHTFLIEQNSYKKANDVTEDHVMFKASTIKDDIMMGKVAFENLFNTTFKKLYPEDKTSLNSILEKYPNLFFSTNTSNLSPLNTTATYPTDVAVISTEVCLNSTLGYDEVHLTLIDKSTGNNVLVNNGISSARLYAVSSGGQLTLKETYNSLSYNDNFGVVSNGGGIFYYNNKNNSNNILPNLGRGENYYIEIVYPWNSGTPSFNTENFNITHTNQTRPFFNLYYTDKGNVDYLDSNFLFTNNSSNNGIYSTVNFLANDPVTFDSRPSIGVTHYDLTLTEVDTGITETISNLNISTDYTFNLREIFTMQIKHVNSVSILKNKYTLEMKAYGCNGINTHSTLFTISSLVRSL